MYHTCVFVFVFLISSCTHNNEQNNYVILGHQQNTKTWVYLCGLTDEWSSKQEMNNRKILARIANKEHIKIICIKPFTRCKQFGNKLCWPHENKYQVKNTYNKIINIISNRNIDGFIGFSNGAFFLNKAVQENVLNKPIISIGGGGYFYSQKLINTKMYLIVGKQDYNHYKNVVQFYNCAKKYRNNRVELITHNGKHMIPENIVQQVIHKLNQSTEISSKQKQ